MSNKMFQTIKSIFNNFFKTEIVEEELKLPYDDNNPYREFNSMKLSKMKKKINYKIFNKLLKVLATISFLSVIAAAGWLVIFGIYIFGNYLNTMFYKQNDISSFDLWNMGFLSLTLLSFCIFTIGCCLVSAYKSSYITVSNFLASKISFFKEDK